MGVPIGWYHAWHRSIPVRQRVSGLGMEGSTTLRDLREYDPAVKVMWDTKRQAVTIWRQPRRGEFPVLVCDSPFGHVIDQRLFRWLIAGDTRRFKSFNEMAAKVDEENDRRERERFQASFNSADHDKLHWAIQREQSQRIGKPLGLMSQVPDQITTGGGSDAGK